MEDIGLILNKQLDEKMFTSRKLFLVCNSLFI